MSDLDIVRAATADPTEVDFDTIVIGAGQSGLSAGFHLRRAGLRFVLLDSSGDIGASWLKRWDSLRLFTPAKYNALPGMAFPGDPYSLPGKNEVASYLEEYVHRFELPVRLRVLVRSLHREAGIFVLTTSQGVLTARSVIVATGANQRPHVPPIALSLASNIVQMHSSEYRNATQIPAGHILVVGAGNSGAQIALELAAAGRDVTLSGRDTGSLPRRLLGRDIYDWLWPTLMRPTVDSRLGRRLMTGRLFSGDPLVGMTPRVFEMPRLYRVGRTTNVENGHPVLDDGRTLDDVAAIVWCTGFRPDFSWIELPVLGLDGYPVHRRGLAIDAPGLAFLGMRFQYRLGSALLGGVAEDAEHVTAATITHVQGARTMQNVALASNFPVEARLRRWHAVPAGPARRPSPSR